MLTSNVKKYIMEKLSVSSEDNIQNETVLSEGKSGAQVCRINVISRRTRNTGVYIVKCLDTTNRWYTHSNSEAERCKNLYKCVPTQFQERLVELVYDSLIDDLHVLIYKQANSSIIHSISLDKMNDTKKMKYLSLVSNELLSKMNIECLQDSTLMTKSIPEFFENILDYRLENSQGKQGSFYKKLESIVNNINATSLEIDGKIYPNPGYYFRKFSEWIPFNNPYNLYKGYMHGDLHCKNIICADNEGLDYSIIDYDSFKEDGFLFFDHAYLELYMYLYDPYNNSKHSWADTMELLISHSIYESVSADNSDFDSNNLHIKIRNSICMGLSDYLKSIYPNVRDDFEVQYCMARIAAGINFFSKGSIDDFDILKKILIYTCESLITLFKLLKVDFSKEIISTITSPEDKQRLKELLWDNCAKMIMSYIPILVTDDVYDDSEYDKLKVLSIIPWGLVWECGKKNAPQDFSTIIPQKMVDRRHIEFFNNSSSIIKYVPDTCMWLRMKQEPGKPYIHTLIPNQNKIHKIWDCIISNNRFKPFLFIFDCKNNEQAAEKLLDLASGSIEYLRGCRFISLRHNFFNDDYVTFYKDYGCSMMNYPNVSLVDLADTINNYYCSESFDSRNDIFLPCIESIPSVPLTTKEIAFYQTSVEIVYPSMENDLPSNSKDGIDFYKGNEASWSDIAHNFDLCLDNNYKNKIQFLCEQLKQGGPHVNILKIKHGAGTGGTTLSKRILWDLKETTPTLRLIRYTPDTANILIEIYNRCKKTILLSVEIGATVISVEELNQLCTDVNAQNGRLWVLQIERIHNSDSVSQEDDSFIKLDDTLQSSIATNFYKKFMSLTTDSARHEYLKKITYASESEWIIRRCPFFYGFYTYEKDYNFSTISRTIEECDKEKLDLLSDLALVTLYSQNITITIPEMTQRISGCRIDATQQIIYESLDTAISKFLIFRNNGWRICHPYIAKTLLQMIYKVSDYRHSVFHAASNYINHMYSIYGEYDSHIDVIFRELFIDRCETDNEKMKFSLLIEQIPEFSKRKEIFDILIKLFPENAHYYNHMARLFVSQDSPDYDEAICLMNKAIEIAKQDNTVATHYVTLGSIYTKRIVATLRQTQELRRKKRYVSSIYNIIQDFMNDYYLAKEAFELSKDYGDPNSSYIYFPRILLESRIIENLVECDQHARNIGTLHKEDKDFQNWYNQHYGDAIQIFYEMQRFCSASKELINDAYIILNRILLEETSIHKNLNDLISKSSDNHIAKRMYTTAIYSRNHYSWANMATDSLELVEKAMRQNINNMLKDEIKRDIDFWFEAYRRLPSFNVDEAIQMITDYKEDGYQKEYILSFLYTIKIEKGLATISDVTKHIELCKNLCPQTINQTYSHDTYSNSTMCCPVISMSDHSKKSISLKKFFGTIQNVHGNSSGIISIDNLNLEAVFMPIINDANGERREYTTKDVLKRVSFNLMFSYSGLRAWNIETCEE